MGSLVLTISTRGSPPAIIDSPKPRPAATRTDIRRKQARVCHKLSQVQYSILFTYDVRRDQEMWSMEGMNHHGDSTKKVDHSKQGRRSSSSFNKLQSQARGRRKLLLEAITRTVLLCSLLLNLAAFVCFDSELRTTVGEEEGRRRRLLLLFQQVKQQEDVPPRVLREQQQQQQQQQQEHHFVHVAILSDRIKGLDVTVASLCQSIDKTTSLALHLVTPEDRKDDVVVDVVSIVSKHCPVGSEVRFIPLHAATEELLSSGFALPWLNLPPPNQAGGDWGLETPYTDNKHFSPLNLLRFYLPHLQEFRHVDRIIFVDDDLVIRGGIKELWEFDVPRDKVLVGGCSHWTWGKATNRFERTHHATVKTTGYVGDFSRTCPDGPISSEDNKEHCTRKTLEWDLMSLSQRINKDQSPFNDRPLERKAFFLGFNLIETKTWKEQLITQKFEQWVTESYSARLFRPNTIAFGLGLSYFAVGDSFVCYTEEQIAELNGLAFVKNKDLAYAGWSMETIDLAADVLHYNGPSKPWDAPMMGCDTANKVFENQKYVPTSTVELWQIECLKLGLCKCDPNPPRLEGNIEAAEEKSSKNTVSTGVSKSNAVETVGVPLNKLQGMDGRFSWLHIPKTGSSFINVLLRHACRNVPPKFHLPYVDWYGRTVDRNGNEWQCDSQFSKLPYLIDPLGNQPMFHLKLFKRVYDRFKGNLVGMLREPKEHFVSLVNHKFHEQVDNITIFDFGRGFQTSYLVGHGYFVATGNEDVGIQHQALIDLAKKRLDEGFQFLGITNRYEESVCLFHLKFETGRCDESEFLAINTAILRSDENGGVDKDGHVWTPEELRQLEDYVDPIDGPVYEYAESLFEAELQKFGVTEEKCREIGCWPSTSSTQHDGVDSNAEEFEADEGDGNDDLTAGSRHQQRRGSRGLKRNKKKKKEKMARRKKCKGSEYVSCR